MALCLARCRCANRPGNSGRDNLYACMRHWTAGWLKRERSALYKKLPWEFGRGRRLQTPVGDDVRSR